MVTHAPYSQTIICTPYTAPCGELLLGAMGDQLCFCGWREDREHQERLERIAQRYRARWEDGETEVLTRAAQQLDEYFARERKTFDIPLALQGSPFEVLVWNALLRIPAGTTCSYKEVAQRIGRTRAVRAVGNACGTNPLLLFIPCHRVISSNGSLGGYAGGLLRIKKWLLALEHSE
ncbi:MAG: methylated-DNA--[protein]-cysteine S-methyltransferase [Bacteroides sp.]